MSLFLSKFGTIPGGKWKPPNCLHEYAMENNTNDSIGEQNGTPINMSYVAGKIGRCGSFNGSSSKIILPALPDLTRALKLENGVTYETWIYHTAWGAGGGADRYAIHDGDGWWAAIISYTPGLLQGLKYTAGGTRIIQATGLLLNTWYHVIYTIYPNMTSQMWVNNISVGTNSNTDQPNNSSGTISIGSHYSASLAWAGYQDIVRFYLGTLTQLQRDKLYNNGNGRQYAAAI